jgi:hypothetical protein
MCKQRDLSNRGMEAGKCDWSGREVTRWAGWLGKRGSRLGTGKERVMLSWQPFSGGRLLGSGHFEVAERLVGVKSLVEYLGGATGGGLGGWVGQSVAWVKGPKMDSGTLSQVIILPGWIDGSSKPVYALSLISKVSNAMDTSSSFGVIVISLITGQRRQQPCSIVNREDIHYNPSLNWTLWDFQPSHIRQFRICTIISIISYHIISYHTVSCILGLSQLLGTIADGARRNTPCLRVFPPSPRPCCMVVPGSTRYRCGATLDPF